MRFVSFDPFRTLQLSGVTYVKPEEFWLQRDLLRGAERLLYPAYWQIHSLVYGLGSSIFPSLPSYHLGHDKIEMTRAFWTLRPEVVPRTSISANSSEARARILDEFALPFVAKTPKSAQGAGVFRIDGVEDFVRYADAHDVLYVQELLPTTRDLRLVVIGREVIGGYWRQRPPDAFHNNLARGGTLCLDPVPAAAVELVLELAQSLGIDHAGFDLMEVDGAFYVLEFNRLFGTAGLQALGIRVSDAIQRYLDSSFEPPRTTSHEPRRRAG